MGQPSANEMGPGRVVDLGHVDVVGLGSGPKFVGTQHVGHDHDMTNALLVPIGTVLEFESLDQALVGDHAGGSHQAIEQELLADFRFGRAPVHVQTPSIAAKFIFKITGSRIAACGLLALLQKLRHFLVFNHNLVFHRLFGEEQFTDVFLQGAITEAQIQEIEVFLPADEALVETSNRICGKSHHLNRVLAGNGQGGVEKQ